MADSLRDAYQLYTRRKFSDVIRILEPQVFKYRGDFNFFHILGMSCLNQGDYGGAFSYLRRAVDLREDDISTLLGISAVYLKRGDSGNAIKLWLDIIELDPGNSYAQRGLNYMKKTENPDEFSDLALEGKINRFFPPPPRKKSVPAALIISMTVAAAVFLVIFLTPLRSSVINFISDTVSFIPGSSRPEIPELELDTRKDFIDVDSTDIFHFTEKEIEKKLKTIQDYLYDFRDNLAQRDINIILNSNASEYIKDRARLLEKYVSEPELTSFSDNFSWDEVSRNPLIYDGCYVLWKGKAANVISTTENISFDFLVGYHEGKSLDGKVPVIFNFAVIIIPDQPIELLSKINIDEYKNIHLEGVSVRRL